MTAPVYHNGFIELCIALISHDTGKGRENDFLEKENVGMPKRDQIIDTDLSPEEIEQILFDNMVIEGVFGPDYNLADLFDKQNVIERHAALNEAFVRALQRSGVGDDHDRNDGDGPTARDWEEARKISARLNLGRKPS